VPELPEVETVRRGLAPALEGGRFEAVEIRRPNLRFPFPDRFAERLQGQRVDSLSRRAKYLVGELSSGEVLLMHLGMSGSFRVEELGSSETPGNFHHPPAKAGPHDHVVFDMSSGARIVFNDPRRFGFMLLIPGAERATHPLMAGLGPEPLGNRFDAAALAAACAGRTVSLKAALSDQRTVAGLGNIYVCEALHAARLSPRRRAATLALRSGGPTPRANALVAAIRTVLNEAIAAGGSSLRDHRRTDGELGMFQHNFRVYDRAGQPCPRPDCTGTIRRVVQVGRSTFYCPVCQR
jgi:formamidopyrimidine-DNA glycosylase